MSKKKPAPKPKPRPKLPGQQKFGSLKDALGNVTETLAMLHRDAHVSLKGRR